MTSISCHVMIGKRTTQGYSYVFSGNYSTYLIISARLSCDSIALLCVSFILGQQCASQCQCFTTSYYNTWICVDVMTLLLSGSNLIVIKVVISAPPIIEPNTQFVAL